LIVIPACCIDRHPGVFLAGIHWSDMANPREDPWMPAKYSPA
jgi:hypothetical protein